jgi:hypothetical protein
MNNLLHKFTVQTGKTGTAHTEIWGRPYSSDQIKYPKLLKLWTYPNRANVSERGITLTGHLEMHMACQLQAA